MGTIIDYLPAKARKFIYSLIVTVFGVEAVCDLAEYPNKYGIIPEKLQAVLFGVASFLGFGMAVIKAKDQLPPPPPPEDRGDVTVEGVIITTAIVIIVVALVIFLSPNLSF